MRGGRGTLGICLANARRSQGGDLDKLSCGLKKRSQKGSPSPSDVPSWTKQPEVDTNGKSRVAVVASLKRKCDQSKTDFILHSGYKVLHCLKESMGRNGAPGASISKAVVLSSAPSKEHIAGMSFGIRGALRSDWPGRGPRATDSHGQYPKGEFWVSGRSGHLKLREMEFPEGEPLSAVPEGLGTRSELSHPYSELYQLPCAYVLPEDEMRRVSLNRLNPAFSEQTIEYEKTQALQMPCSHGVTGSAVFPLASL